MGKIIIPGANHQGELEEQEEKVKWYNKGERAIIKEDRIIIERLYEVEQVIGKHKKITKVKSVTTQHENGRQDCTAFVPRVGTKSRHKKG